jgi:DNA helicase II / ATP-dependent DNA helicase PcrA
MSVRMQRTTEDLTAKLNGPQRDAVLQVDGPLLVLAGAGSGKTRVITHRIAHLIDTVCEPRRILAVTFTNKAAGEMRDRVDAILPGNLKGLWIGTFHSICARLLRMNASLLGLEPSFTICDMDDQRRLVTQVLRTMHLPERMFAPREILASIDRAKNDGIGPKDYEGEDFFGDLVAKVYPEYQQRLLAANSVDFGDLLRLTNQLLEENPDVRTELSRHFRYILVDEFQDTNKVQYDLIRNLSSEHHNLCVVGDDDQSIYAWRGADISNILNFESDHPNAKVIKLEQNYRSTQTILDAAAGVISRNLGRKGKKLWTDKGEGEPIHYVRCTNEREEAAYVANTIRNLRSNGNYTHGDVAIFYRTHAQSRVIEDALRSAKPSIPYAVVGGIRFYDRAEVKDLLAYLKLLTNPLDDISLLRIINKPTRGIGQTTIDKLVDYSRSSNQSLWQAALAASKNAGDAKGVLRAGPRKKVHAFCELIEGLTAELEDSSPAQIAESVLGKTGTMERLALDGSAEANTRIENLMELVGGIRDYERGGGNNEDRLVELGEEEESGPTLNGYLQQVTLSTSVDVYSEDDGQVTMMTAHSAKGLEYPVVFIIGLETGIFPHSRSLDDEEQMEEERRLAYVAITRAEDRLYLSNAQSRFFFGKEQVNPPSEFISEIPAELIERHSLVKTYQAPMSYGNNYSSAASTRRPARTNTMAGGSNQEDEVDIDVDLDDDIDAADEGGDWVDYDFDQSEPEEEISYRLGMKVRHKSFGVGVIRGITGTAPNLNLTINFPSMGPRTIRCQYVEPAR